jgi:hypothetical protein
LSWTRNLELGAVDTKGMLSFQKLRVDQRSIEFPTYARGIERERVDVNVQVLVHVHVVVNLNVNVLI